MMDDKLCFTPAADLARMMRTREVSPVEVAHAVIHRIQRFDRTVNAFSQFIPELVLNAAREAERALMAGEETGVLHGVPVTVKDLFDLEGFVTESGSRTQAAASGKAPAANDCPVVARMKAAGAVILGKTTTSEFGWTGVSRSPLTGITHNPWKPGFNAGASSSGAGVCAAAGFGPIHQGSDGAGSIRMPAHFSGVFGLKPTWGLLPYVPVRNNDLVSHMGPLARSVEDAALFLNATAGAHALDHTSLTAIPPDFTDGLSRDIGHLRVAFSPDLGHARVDAEVAGPVAEAAKVFESFGCNVEEVVPAWGIDGPEIGCFFWSVHEAPLKSLLEQWEERMDPGLVACIRAGSGYGADTYLDMRARKLDYIRCQHQFMQDWDLLLTPAVSVAAFPAERLQPAHWPEHPWNWLSWSEFCYPFNMSGLPAASVPCGWTDVGLPVGLQIVGRRGADADVLRAAATFERARPWAERQPELTPC